MIKRRFTMADLIRQAEQGGEAEAKAVEALRASLRAIDAENLNLAHDLALAASGHLRQARRATVEGRIIAARLEEDEPGTGASILAILRRRTPTGAAP
jgi:hypothetical protein